MLPQARERAVRPLARTSKQAYRDTSMETSRRQSSNKPAEARHCVFRHSLILSYWPCQRLQLLMIKHNPIPSAPV